MELAADLDAPCPPEELFAWVDDLARYPSWLSIVTRAEAYAGDPLAWSVDLRGRVGPFARSKRLRMVRTSFEPSRLAVFERAGGRRPPARRLGAAGRGQPDGRRGRQPPRHAPPLRRRAVGAGARAPPRRRDRAGPRCGLLELVSAAQALKRPPPLARAGAGRPKHSLRLASVSVVASGPGASTRPCRRSSAWVKPGGISSTWWVTSTAGGAVRVGGQGGEGRHELLAAAEVEAGGRLVEQHQPGLGHQRPGQQHPLALAGGAACRACRSARSPDAEAVEQGPGRWPVGLVVAVPPRLERAVAGASSRRRGRVSAGRSWSRQRRAGEADPVRGGGGRRPGRARSPSTSTSPGRRVQVERGDAEERRLARAVAARAPPSARRSRTSQSMPSRMARPSRDEPHAPQRAGRTSAHAGAAMGSSSRCGPPAVDRGRDGVADVAGVVDERRPATPIDGPGRRSRPAGRRGPWPRSVPVCDRVAPFMPRRLFLRMRYWRLFTTANTTGRLLVGRGPQRLRRVHGRPVAHDAQHRLARRRPGDTPSAAGMPQPEPAALAEEVAVRARSSGGSRGRSTPVVMASSTTARAGRHRPHQGVGRGHRIHRRGAVALAAPSPRAAAMRRRPAGRRPRRRRPPPRRRPGRARAASSASTRQAEGRPPRRARTG